MPNEPGHPLVEIKDALADFVAVESELAVVELTPTAKSAGIGAGLFAGAAVFVFHVIWMLVLAVALGVALLISLTGMGPLGSITLGIVASMVFSLIVAAVLVLLGRNKFREIQKPEATIAEAKATLDAVVDVVAKHTSPPQINPANLPSEKAS